MAPTSAPHRLLLAEPSALWCPRPQLVVDCSALAAWLFDEPDAAQQALARLEGHQLHAPTLLPYEVANVARKKRRAGLPDDALAQMLAEFDTQQIDLHPVWPADSLPLAERYGLSAYDAAYLWLAADLRLPLATFDTRLHAAAVRHLGQA